MSRTRPGAASRTVRFPSTARDAVAQLHDHIGHHHGASTASVRNPPALVASTRTRPGRGFDDIADDGVCRLPDRGIERVDVKWGRRPRPPSSPRPGLRSRPQAPRRRERSGRSRGPRRVARRSRGQAPGVASPTSADDRSDIPVAFAGEQPQPDRDRDQSLLGAVMQVALETLPLVGRGHHDALAGGCQIGELRSRLGLEPFVLEPESCGANDFIDRVRQFEDVGPVLEEARRPGRRGRSASPRAGRWGFGPRSRSRPAASTARPPASG